MALEAGTFLADLVPTNPDGADGKAEGDNHIRLMKTVLQATFPGMAGRVWRNQTKSAGYNVVLIDNMSLIDCTALLTLTFTAAATLGNGYLILVHASGGDVTLDPNGTELVNGTTTIVIPQGMCAVVVCTGTAFKAFLIPTVSAWTTADVKLTYKTVADVGWVMANDGTIGNAASGGTTRANADTVALFTHFWNTIPDGICPVSGGRGGSAAADFAANKTLTIPKTLGRALAVSGTGFGLTARALGDKAGTETHTLTQAQTPMKTHGHTNTAHPHPGSSIAGGAGTNNLRDQDRASGGGSADGFAAGSNNATIIGTASVTVVAAGINIDATGDATADPHPIVSPETFLNVMIKL